MGLVDEQDGRPERCLHFVDDAFQAPLELALHAGTGLQQAHVEGQQLDVPQRRRHPCGDPRGQAFDDGGLADASLADHDGVVFRRRARMSTIWRIAPSRQSTGSSLPSRACWVRLWVKRCNRDSPPPGLPLGAPSSGCEARNPSTARCRAAPAAAGSGCRHSATGCVAGPGSMPPGRSGYGPVRGWPATAHPAATAPARARTPDCARRCARPRLQRGVEFAGVHRGILQGARQRSLGTLQQASNRSSTSTLLPPRATQRSAEPSRSRRVSASSA